MGSGIEAGRRPGRGIRAPPGIAGWLLALLGLGATLALAGEGRQEPRGPYFGQPPPGIVPAVFAPGIVSLADRYEYVIAFSPDGTECCFGVTNSSWSTCDLYYSRREGGKWTEPAPAAFQQGSDGWLPSFSPDGKRLFFSSGRPDMRMSNSYVCRKTAEGWSAPVKLGAPVNSPAFDWRPALTSSGTLYFSSNRDGGEGDSDIYRAVPVDGEFREVQNLGPPVNRHSWTRLPTSRSTSVS